MPSDEEKQLESGERRAQGPGRIAHKGAIVGDREVRGRKSVAPVHELAEQTLILRGR